MVVSKMLVTGGCVFTSAESFPDLLGCEFLKRTLVSCSGSKCSCDVFPFLPHLPRVGGYDFPLDFAIFPLLV